MPLIEIIVYEGDNNAGNEFYIACEKADSLDPQDLQDALTAAFHSVEQDIWYGDQDDEPIGSALLGDVVDVPPFFFLADLITDAVVDATTYLADILTGTVVPKPSHSGYDRQTSSGYDQPDDDDGADLRPQFSD